MIQLTWIEDIGAYIISRGIGTTSDIYYQGFSEDVPNCITLFVAPGQDEKYTLRRTMVLSRPELDIRVRNEGDAEAKSIATDIHTILNGKKGVLGSTNFKKIKALQDPFFVEQETDNDRFIYGINFQLQINR